MIIGWHQTKKTIPGPKILLLMHFDVVPVEKSWEKAFSMTINDDPQFGETAEGRGVTDMKGSIAALLNSLTSISAIDTNICIAFTSDEELGGFYGTNNLVAEVFLKKKKWMPNYVITGDAAGEEIINLRRNAHFIRATFPRTKKTIRGKKIERTFNTTINSSKTSHAAYFRSEIDKHAVYEASHHFKSNEKEYVFILNDNQFIKSNVIPKKIVLESISEDEHESEEFEIEDSFTQIIRMLSELVTIPLPQGKSALGTNITPNIINFFEDTFEILIDLRSMLHATEKSMIEDALRSLFKQTIFEPQIEIVSSAGPIITKEDSILVKSAKEAWKNVTGNEINTAERGGATDARYFSYRGIECIDIGPIGFNVHGTHETVVLESLERLSSFFPELIKILSSKKEN
jgi:acetylornithine deacetylase/succinyl-diaminopimelate desuccinylase-like protein